GWLRPAGRGRYEVPATRVVPLLVVLTAAAP
ncbi:ArsR family transcriptional regulator, partial [Streptomyces sp. ZEA17I]